jgi:hypothetical protein
LRSLPEEDRARPRVRPDFSAANRLRTHQLVASPSPTGVAES